MKRLLGLIVVALIGATVAFGPAQAQDNSEATISALQTKVAERDERISSKSTQIADLKDQIAKLKTQVADLKGQLPPTPTPTPKLSGKEAYPYVGDALEIYTRPFNHIGEKMSFCGTVSYIEVAKPGNKFYPGDTTLNGWNAVAQVAVDGVDARFVLGFDGDTSGIYEDSYVCAWGTLVDTFTGQNAFGGTISNPFFDAEYFELA